MFTLFYIHIYTTDSYKSAKAQAEMIYQTAMGIAMDGVYTTVYMERLQSILSHPEYRNTFYYGGVYQAYKTTARTYRALAEIIAFGEAMTNYELDEQTVNAIANELGLEDTSVLEDENGKITVSSTVLYVEEFLRENELPEDAEKHITELLNTAEDAAEMAALASDAYKADLTALKMQIETIVSTLSSTSSAIIPFLNAEAKAEYEACIADLNQTVVNISAIMEGEMTEEELNEVTECAEGKAADMLKKIENDLTEAEKIRVQQLIAQAENSIKTLTSEFSASLTLAENNAKAEIERSREERKNNVSAAE